MLNQNQTKKQEQKPSAMEWFPDVAESLKPRGASSTHCVQPQTVSHPAVAPNKSHKARNILRADLRRE
jgi:hypothetical protein